MVLQDYVMMSLNYLYIVDGESFKNQWTIIKLSLYYNEILVEYRLGKLSLINLTLSMQCQ